jgi:hypothetical protein
MNARRSASRAARDTLNTSGAPEVISTSASALGMKAGPDYLLNDLWSHRQTETTGTISAEVPALGPGTIYLKGAVGSTATITTEVTRR